MLISLSWHDENEKVDDEVNELLDSCGHMAPCLLIEGVIIIVGEEASQGVIQNIPNVSKAYFFELIIIEQKIGDQQDAKADVVGRHRTPGRKAAIIGDVEVATKNQDPCQDIKQCSQSTNQMVGSMKSSFLIGVPT